MDKLFYRTMLLDFYGELLTEKQYSVYEMHFLNDCSLNEIAQELGTTRQAVWDLVNRTEKLMTGYDEKLDLVRKHIEAQRVIEEIEDILKSAVNESTAEKIRNKLKSLVEREG